MNPNINWKVFDYSEDGMTITVKWWSKDFSAYCEVGDVTLSYGLHIMYMCPKVYSEELLRAGYCPNAIKLLREAKNYLEENPDFFENYKNSFDSLFSEESGSVKKIREEKRIKKAQFKSGEITLKEWQDFLKEYRKVASPFTEEKSQYPTTYVRSLFIKDLDVQDILINCLKKRFSC